jgi:ribosomal protein L34E
MINTRSKKRYNVKTPGGRNVIHIKKKKHATALCVSCGAKLNRIKLTLRDVRNMTKSQKSPSRPYSDLCSSCMRERIKEKARA